MSGLLSRVLRLENRLAPPERVGPIFFQIDPADPARPDLLGFKAGMSAVGTVSVLRLPGESVKDLERRCRELHPACIVWFGIYA